MKKNKVKNFILNIAVLVIAVFISFMGIEVYFRITKYVPHASVPPYLYANHNNTWWTLRANYKKAWMSGEGKIEYFINSQGIRAGQDFEYKPKGSKRIFIIGDSFTFGIGVNSESTFSNKLDYKFKIIEENTEVINLGVPGFGTMQAYYRLLEYAKLLGIPDHLIYVFCPNDPVDNISGKKVVVGGIRIDEERKNKLFLSLIGHLYYKSRFVAYVLDNLYTKHFNPRFEKAKNLKKQKIPMEKREDFISMKKYVKNICLWSKKNGVRMFVISTSRSEYSEALKRYLKYFKVDFLEGSEVFERKNIKNEKLSLKEGHWNEKGHEFFADGLKEYLMENKWLKFNLN